MRVIAVPMVLVCLVVCSAAGAQPDPCARWYGKLDSGMIRNAEDAVAFNACLPAIKAQREQARADTVQRHVDEKLAAPRPTLADSCRALASHKLARGTATLEGQRDLAVLRVLRQEVTDRLAAFRRTQQPASQPAARVAQLGEWRPIVAACADPNLIGADAAEYLRHNLGFLERQQAAYEEAQCQADAKCRAAKLKEKLASLTEHICEAAAERASILAKIAEEKRGARRVGVINLRYLEELKGQLQDSEAAISAAKTEYRGVAKRPFRASCK